jgi:hypothetical protein
MDLHWCQVQQHQSVPYQDQWNMHYSLVSAYFLSAFLICFKNTIAILKKIICKIIIWVAQRKLCFEFKIKTQLLYFVSTDITRTFRRNSSSRTADLFRTKLHIASILYQIFTAVIMKMYKSCDASRESRFGAPISKTQSYLLGYHNM